MQNESRGGGGGGEVQMNITVAEKSMYLLINNLFRTRAIAFCHAYKRPNGFRTLWEYRLSISLLAVVTLSNIAPL